MSKKRLVQLYMPNGGQDGVILLWRPRKKDDPKPVKWVEVRGRPFSEWEIDEDTPMSRVHDCMHGWHSCVLHQDAVLTLYDDHSDFEAVFEFFNQENVEGDLTGFKSCGMFREQDIRTL